MRSSGGAMKRTSAAAFSLLIISLLPGPLSAKGRTVKVTIKGAGLTTPLEITDPKVWQFPIWSGPGVSRNAVEETDGFIINWAKGIVVQVPAGLQQYEVSFYSGCIKGEGCRTTEPFLSYVVLYAYDRSTEQGYVYLPGRTDELFKFNHAMSHGHGFEGNWLYATREWEDFARPLIAR